MIALNAEAKAALRRRHVGLVSLWNVVRADGATYRYATHDRGLDSATIAGFSSYPGTVQFAVRTEIGIAEDNTELQGAFDTRGTPQGGLFGQGRTPTGITKADIEAKRLLNARVQQIEVPWEYPWITLAFHEWLVREASEVGERFSLQLVSRRGGQPGQEQGPMTSRRCSNTLGVNDPPHSYCQVDLFQAPFGNFDVPITSVTSKREFRVSGLTNPAHVEQFFNQGRAAFRTGASAGAQRRVIISTPFGGSGEFDLELSEPVPYQLQVGDTLHLFAGCDLEFGTCRDRFNQHRNSYRGQKDMRGVDILIATPDAQ